MMKASFTGNYDGDYSGATGSFVVNSGGLNLRASITADSVANRPSVNGVTLSLENPASFIVDYNVPKQDIRFQFMNSVRVKGKPLNFTYTHSVGDRRTALDGMLMLDTNHKVSANYGFELGNCKVKYCYVHGGVTSVEPSYDFGNNSWELGVSRRIVDGSVVRGCYRSDTKVLGVDLRTKSFSGANVKIAASVNLAEEKLMPKVTAETIWDFEM
uniref:outer envelope pore protein 24A, chloroplastic-like n=1 Tax=Erigeron canadensis TaxID=72917 RepID=UPI001CB9780F|nr:outer envelope pore protein 24A, chloroplastic-like [Erigeron canadensis]